MPAFRGPLRSQRVLPLFFLAHALTLAFLRLALALAVGFAFAFPCADLAAPQDRHTDPLIFDLHRVAQAGAQPRGSGSPHPTSSEIRDRMGDGFLLRAIAGTSARDVVAEKRDPEDP